MLHCLKHSVQTTGINPYAEGRELKFKGLVNDKYELSETATEILEEVEEFFSIQKEKVLILHLHQQILCVGVYCQKKGVSQHLHFL